MTKKIGKLELAILSDAFAIVASKGGFPLSRNFYVRTDVKFNGPYVRKLK